MQNALPESSIVATRKIFSLLQIPHEKKLHPTKTPAPLFTTDHF